MRLALRESRKDMETELDAEMVEAGKMMPEKRGETPGANRAPEARTQGCICAPPAVGDRVTTLDPHDSVLWILQAPSACACIYVHILHLRARVFAHSPGIKTEIINLTGDKRTHACMYIYGTPTLVAAPLLAPALQAH